MTIFKSRNSVEEYKYRTLSKDLNEISGRTGREEITKFVNKKILKIINKIAPENCNLIDVGCGDGTLVKLSSKESKYKKIAGISPNQEEVDLITKSLKLNKFDPRIEIKKGLSHDIPYEDNIFDFVVINGVLLILDNEQTLIDSLIEIKRIMKLDSFVLIGEMPFVNEFSDAKYGDSISKWLFHVLRKKGIAEFIRRSKQVIRSLITNEPFLIVRKKVLFYKKEEFTNLIEKIGFELVFAKIHKEIDNNGEEYESETRYNYLFKKISI